MKIAPLQPRGLVFQEVFVQPCFDEDGLPISTENFDFSGVAISCEVGYGEPTDDQDAAVKNAMLVSLKFSIDNNEGKKSPYNIRISASGMFEWMNNETDRSDRRDLTVVNGASMVFGAIREMVTNVTSRSLAGTLILPAFNFLDSKPSITEALDKSQQD